MSNNKRPYKPWSQQWGKDVKSSYHYEGSEQHKQLTKYLDVYNSEPSFGEKLLKIKANTKKLLCITVNAIVLVITWAVYALCIWAFSKLVIYLLTDLLRECL